MRIKNNFLWLGMLLCVLMICRPVVWAEDPLKTVEAVGTIRIQGEKIAEAREAAISNGLAAAVDRAILEMIPVEAAAANFSTITALFYTNVNQFVQGYKVLAESRGGGFYRVMVQAVVSTGAVQKHLSDAGISLQGKKALPSILLMVSEKQMESPDLHFWWGQDPGTAKPVTEGLLAKVFQEKGYEIAGNELISRSDPALVPLRQNANPGNIQVAEIGARTGADMVIAGSITLQRASGVTESGSKTVQAVMTLRAVRSGAGDEIAVAEQTALGSAAEEAAAIEQAMAVSGKAAAEELSKQMAAAWQKQTRKTASVELVIEGTSQLGKYSAFRSALSKVSGIKGILIKEMKADKSTLILDYSGGARQLAEVLMLKNYDGFAITIPEVTQNQIKIVLVPGQQ